MFGLGATELVVILVLALILLGPSKLPQVASGLGKAIRQFRKATRDLSSQLDIDDDVKAPFRELRAAMRDEPAPYVPPAPVVAAAPVGTVAAPGAALGAAAATPPAESTGLAPIAAAPSAGSVEPAAPTPAPDKKVV